MAKNAEKHDDTRSSLRTMIIINIILMSLLLVDRVYAFVETMFRRDRDIVAMAPDGRVYPLVPLSQPYVTQSSLFGFCDDALQASFTLDFKNWREQTNAAEPFYSQEGYKNYKTELDQQQFISRIIKEFRVSSVARRGAWVISDKRVLSNGVYFWRLEAPVYLTLSGKDGDVPFESVLVYDVIRTSNVDNIRGVVVNAFRFAPKKT